MSSFVWPTFYLVQSDIASIPFSILLWIKSFFSIFAFKVPWETHLLFVSAVLFHAYGFFRGKIPCFFAGETFFKTNKMHFVFLDLQNFLQKCYNICLHFWFLGRFKEESQQNLVFLKGQSVQMQVCCTLSFLIYCNFL